MTQFSIFHGFYCCSLGNANFHISASHLSRTMHKELLANGTWTLVPYESQKNV